MDALAAVMTGKGAGAISNIQLVGADGAQIIEKIFKSAGGKPTELEPGKILLGHITNGKETIDQIVIGCEGPDNFAINCHGNPLIVEMIMKLLQKNGAEPVLPEELLKQTFTTQGKVNTIALEAKLAQLKAVTLDGTKIISNQVQVGLAKTAARWLNDIDSTSVAIIARQAEAILESSKTAKLIIKGCKVAIVGPPNSGKSTLLNCLCGRQKSIVTDIAGTTRDWVGATCRLESILMELFDTAGLYEMVEPANAVDKAAQQKTAELLTEADLVLLVLDASQSAQQLDEVMLEEITDKKVLTLLNKSDLPAKFDEKQLPENLARTVKISALLGEGIDNLVEKVRRALGVSDSDLCAPACFTSRQEGLLKKLAQTKSKGSATSFIRELLNGQL